MRCIYMARQSIFNKHNRIFGYELLHRENEQNYFIPNSPNKNYTCELISNAMLTFGISNIAKGKYAFINFDRDVIMSDIPFLLNPNEMIIEILEDVEIDEELLERLKRLKEKNYLLAMDDYIGKTEYDSLIKLVDIIKVDFKMTTEKMRREIAIKYKNKVLLAEKVETEEEYEQAKRDGYSLFQGYYFSKPLMLSKKTLDIAENSYINLWKEIKKENPSYDNLVSIINKDVNLILRLLQKVNTVNYYRGKVIYSIKEALVRLGMTETSRWIILLLMQDVTMKNQDHHIQVALIRGILAEQICVQVGLGKYKEEAYIRGMFSVMEQKDKEEILTFIKKVDQTIENRIDAVEIEEILKNIINLTKYYEEAKWDEVDLFAKQYKVPKELILKFYLEAIDYANNVFRIE